MQLQNKTIILSGVGRIGNTVAKDLVEAGANVAVTYRQTKPEYSSDRVLTLPAELTNAADIRRVVAETKKKFGQIDGLIHMAATYERVAWKDLSEEAWDRNIQAIAKSAFLVTKIVGDELLKNSGEVKGKIILFSDWSVLDQPYKDYLAYNSAKAAVVGLCKSLAKELAPGIAVNCIAPGPILRPPDLSDSDNEEVMANTPLKRWGGPEEIAKAALYLLNSDFVTGQVLYVDGGRSIA
jgi:pteridine reductase